jgi:hypothetical protein
MTTVQDNLEVAPATEFDIEQMAEAAAEYIPSTPASDPAPTTEDTTQPDLQRIRDDNAYLLQQMREMSYAPSTPDLKPGDVIHHGDADAPYPMVTHESAGPAKVFIYRTNTGEKKTTTTNLLQGVLKKRFSMDHPTHPGERAFATVDPGFRLAQGTIKCRLHKDDPNRSLYDFMGLPICTKSNITSNYQRDLHMEKKHPTAAKTLESDRLRQEREEDRAFQRTLMAGVGALQPAEIATVPVDQVPQHVCHCGKSFKTKGALGSHRRRHAKR